MTGVMVTAAQIVVSLLRPILSKAIIIVITAAELTSMVMHFKRERRIHVMANELEKSVDKATNALIEFLKFI